MLLSLHFSCNKKTEKKAPKKPNILFIMTDDHTTNAMSCYGSNLIETPNLDRIAKEGILFNNCFVNNSICAPSRAAILTGKFSHLNGVTDNAKVFDGSQLTYPKLLQKAGYQTSVIGKWHLGSAPTGFDYWCVLPGQGDYYQPDFIEMGDTIQVDGYVTDVITGKAIKWLDKDRDASKPFAMVYQHKAPHRNWIPAPRHLGKLEDVVFPEPENLYDDYEGRGTAAHEQEMELSVDLWTVWDLKVATREQLESFGKEHKDDNENFQEKAHDMATANKKEDEIKMLYNVFKRMTEAQKELWFKAYEGRTNEFYSKDLKGKELISWKYQNYMRDYLGCLLSLDENIGHVLDYLEEKGELDNTIIVYTSDQGFFLGEHGWFDKRFMYEEVYRMPLLVRYPKTIEPGSVTDALAMNIDFAPTLLDYAGVEIPKEMQGVSLRPVLDNHGKTPDDWRKSSYYHYYEYPSWHSVKRHYGIRTQKYKLIHFYNDIDEWELYDMEKDPQEMKNIYNEPENKELIEELKLELKKQQSLYQDHDPDEKEHEFFHSVMEH
ncbi:sulfatase family protein [Aestuariivivens insulae]|nr:sulfatase [Aestuariivivens insulae]